MTFSTQSGALSMKDMFRCHLAEYSNDLMQISYNLIQIHQKLIEFQNKRRFFSYLYDLIPTYQNLIKFDLVKCGF